MKHFTSLFFVITLTGFTFVCNAQGVPGPTIKKGSVITYDVKEGKSTYRYTVTIDKFSEATGISFHWATNEKPSRSGTTSMPFANLEDAKKLMVKPIPGNEKLTEDQLRVLFNNSVVVTLVGSKTVDIDVDGTAITFLYLATKDETADIDYNGSKTTVDHTSADGGDTRIGFITVGDYQLIHSFVSKDLRFTLLSISTK